jgi:hypothetical protein
MTRHKKNTDSAAFKRFIDVRTPIAAAVDTPIVSKLD